MISIIIPNLNSNSIQLTLRSLHRQNYDMDDAEVLVVGMDEPNLVTEDQLVRFIPTQHPVNPATARNIGMRKAKGDPILFIDADCIPAPDWVSRMIQYHRVSGAKIVGGAITFHRGNLWTLADNVAMFRDYLPFTVDEPHRLLLTGNLSFCLAVFLAVGEMDESLSCAEDIDWMVRCRLKGYELFFEPRALVCHDPPRTTLRAVMKHWINTGQYMSEVLNRHQTLLNPPFAVKHRWLMLGLAPAIAAFLAGRIFWSSLKQMYRYLDIIPLIYLAELDWCWVMFKGLTKMKKREG